MDMALTEFARSMMTNGEDASVSYSDDIRKSLVEVVSNAAREVPDSKARDRILGTFMEFDNQVRHENVQGAIWRGLGAVSFYLHELNRLYVFIDEDYRQHPEESKAITSHEVREMYWVMSKKRDFDDAAKTMLIDRGPTQLSSMPYLHVSALALMVPEYTKEFIINREVEETMPGEYASLVLLNLGEQCSMNKKALRELPRLPGDAYAITKFLNVLETSIWSLPVESSPRQTQASIDGIKKAKNECLSLFSEGDPYGLSEEVYSIFESIPRNPGKLAIYKTFNSLLDAFDRLYETGPAV